MTRQATHNGASDTREAPEIVAALSLDLLERTDELAAAMAEHLHRQIPELGGDDAELLRETRESCASNIEQSNRLLHGGGMAEDLTVTPAALGYVRGFVSRGLSIAVLLRTYRLGHAWIWEIWSKALRERADGPEELAAAIEYSSRWMFEYIDLVSAALVEQFAEEQARRARGAEQLREATVRQILDGGPVDVAAASRRLGYELDGGHVAIHVWGEMTGGADVERAARELAAVVGDRSLTIAAGAVALDVWCAVDPGDAPEALARVAGLTPPEGILAAVGDGADLRGVEGFRAARDAAREAARVRELAGERLGPLTLHRDVELAALLSDDPGRARRFLATRLGALAAGDEPTARLRETLLAYLACNRSAAQAAKRLFVHPNTVSYRVNRAQELLGRDLAETEAELLCALILASVTGVAPSA